MSPNPEDFKSRVWVNERWLTSDTKKAEKWSPDPKQGRTLWGLCFCGETIYEGDSVGMRGDHIVVVCYDCWMSGTLTECHLDCAGLKFPDATLSQ